MVFRRSKTGGVLGLYRGLKSGKARMRFPFKKLGAKRFKTAVQRVVNMKKEVHYRDRYLSSQGGPGLPPTGDIYCVNDGIGEGSDVGQRVGRSIQGKYITFVGYAVPPSNLGRSDALKICLVYDKQPSSAALAAFGDVWDTVNGSGTAGPLLLRNTLTTAGRFVCVRTYWLSDLFQGTAGGSSASENKSKSLEFTYQIPSRWAKTIYSGTGAGVPNTGAWLLTVVGMNNSGGSNASTLFFTTRYAFTDD